MADVQIFGYLGVRIASSFLREQIAVNANSLTGRVEPSADFVVFEPYFI